MWEKITGRVGAVLYRQVRSFRFFRNPYLLAHQQEHLLLSITPRPSRSFSGWSRLFARWGKGSGPFRMTKLSTRNHRTTCRCFFLHVTSTGMPYESRSVANHYNPPNHAPSLTTTTIEASIIFPDCGHNFIFRLHNHAAEYTSSPTRATTGHVCPKS